MRDRDRPTDPTRQHDRCATCDGAGDWCGQHETPDGCDCEDDAPRLPCPDCGGTGLSNDDTDDDDTD